MQKVIAGIITYNPDLGILAQAVESVSGQVEEVVVIDNGSANLKFLQYAEDKKTIQDDEKKKLLQCIKGVKVIWNKKIMVWQKR